MNRRLEDLANLGPATAKRLSEIGIADEEQLRTVGALQAYARLRFVFGTVINLNALYALDAALTDTPLAVDHGRAQAEAAQGRLRRSVTTDGVAGKG